MEKLIYVIWKREGESAESFRQEILGPTGRRILDLGARGLSVNLADDLAAFSRNLRISRMEKPMDGTVSVWVDTHTRRAPIEEALERVTGRLAGYLALESMPIVNDRHRVVPGERLPGLYTIAFLQKPDFLTYEQWIDIWQGSHTQVAIETQSTFLYIQNVLVRALTKDAPPWTAIVEEAFPREAATDPMVFYDAGGDAEKLHARQMRMFDSCKRFIDFNQLESHPMSAYVLRTED